MIVANMPANHECWRLTRDNSLANVMEGLLGIMWAEINLKHHDLEVFCNVFMMH